MVSRGLCSTEFLLKTLKYIQVTLRIFFMKFGINQTDSVILIFSIYVSLK